MQHGGDLREAIERYGGKAADWLDLSSGINPWPWPVPALPMAVWQRLPSRDAYDALIAAARAAYRVDADAGLVAAPGTQALIQWLPRLAAPGAVAILSPTYDEHARAWHHAGHDVTEIVDLGRLPPEVRHCIVVNPNNPDGRVSALPALQEAAALVAARGGWLVVDESFADVDPAVTAVDLCVDRPVIVLRSFGKFFGLAGLRLGFAIAPPIIARRLVDALGPWAVSGAALAIGEAALRDAGWAAAMRQKLHVEAVHLDQVLAAASLTLVGGTALYRLVRTPQAAVCHDALARQRIWCRRFDHALDLLRFGLPPSAEARDRLAAALAQR